MKCINNYSCEDNISWNNILVNHSNLLQDAVSGVYPRKDTIIKLCKFEESNNSAYQVIESEPDGYCGWYSIGTYLLYIKMRYNVAYFY